MDLPESLLIGQDYDEEEGKSYWRIFTEEVEAFNWLMSDYPHHRVWRISTQGTVEMRPSLVPVEAGEQLCEHCDHEMRHHFRSGCTVKDPEGQLCLCYRQGD